MIPRVYAKYFAIIAIAALCTACDTNVTTVVADQEEQDETLLRYCGGCHGLPKPASRPASEWPAIVWRMQTYRTQRALPELTEVEVKEITEYLMKKANEH